MSLFRFLTKEHGLPHQSHGERHNQSDQAGSVRCLKQSQIVQENWIYYTGSMRKFEPGWRLTARLSQISV